MAGTREMSGLDLAAAKHIRMLAAGKKMKQTELADAAGIPRSTFNRYFNGERSMTVGELGRILDALGTSYADEAQEIAQLMAGE